MNLQNRNNLILSLIAETQFDAYVQGYMAKAGAAAGASDNLLVEAEGAAMLQGLVAPVRAQQRACGQPLQNALLQIAHDLLLQTKSQLAIAANASSIHVIQRDMNRAIWNIATADPEAPVRPQRCGYLGPHGGNRVHSHSNQALSCPMAA